MEQLDIELDENLLAALRRGIQAACSDPRCKDPETLFMAWLFFHFNQAVNSVQFGECFADELAITYAKTALRVRDEAIETLRPFCEGTH